MTRRKEEFVKNLPPPHSLSETGARLREGPLGVRREELRPAEVLQEDVPGDLGYQ